ncbi:hypothetical protein GCM10010168_65410 [Actinoplanes ianthinogenes]|nr:hypothetical protein GCM10010168_65410 [Actinoplanes ianthinogenes]
MVSGYSPIDDSTTMLSLPGARVSTVDVTGVASTKISDASTAKIPSAKPAQAFFTISDKCPPSLSGTVDDLPILSPQRSLFEQVY